MCLRALKIFALGSALLAGGAACNPSTSSEALRVAGVSFTETELLGLSTDRRQLLAELTAFGAEVADSTIEALVAPAIASRVAQRGIELLQAQRTLDSAGVDDAVLLAHYRTNPRYELTVRHLLVFSDRAETAPTRARAEARAQAALQRIRAGEDLAAVAAEVSEEPGAEARQGLLTPGREGAWVGEFWQAALALAPGEISPVTETQYGFHVLRLEARDTVPFVEVRNEVVLDVARQLRFRPQTVDAEAEAEWLAASTAAGIEVTPAWRASIEQEEFDAALAQATMLGFVVGMPRSALKEAALAALSATGQNKDLARREIRSRYGGLLAQRHGELQRDLAAQSDSGLQ